MNPCDVIVVGGGVIGCAVAWTLARDGRSVVVLERDRIAAHASRVAAGMLVPSMEAADPTDPLSALGARSLQLYPGWVEALVEQGGPDPVFRPGGSLRVARSEADEALLRDRAPRFADRGAMWIDAAALRARAPGLNADVRGAMESPGEGYVESGPLTRALAHAARALGVRIEQGAPAVEILRDGNRVRGVRTPREQWSAAWVVLASGPWAASGAIPLEEQAHVPVAPRRGQLLVFDAVRPAPGRVVSDGSVYLVPRADGRLVVGATEERAGFDCRTTDAGIDALTRAAIDLAPGLAGAVFREARVGLRPETPDGLPCIGPVAGLDGALWAAGHHRNGILLAPLTGRWIADRVAGKAPPAEAAAVDPARFRVVGS